MTAEGGQGAGGRVAREFIEDGATGAFYNLNDPGLWRRITRFFERKVGEMVFQIDRLRLSYFPLDPFQPSLSLVVHSFCSSPAS